MCDKCDSGNYIRETSNRLRFRLNNHKKSIRDNSRGFPVSVHFNQPDHLQKNLRCVILRGEFKTTEDRLICEQTFIHTLKTHSKGVNQDLSFLSLYSYFHQCCRPLTSTSVNNTEVWRQKLSYVFFYSHLSPVHHWGRTQECSKALVILLSFYWIKVSQLRFILVFYIYIITVMTRWCLINQLLLTQVKTHNFLALLFLSSVWMD